MHNNIFIDVIHSHYSYSCLTSADTSSPSSSSSSSPLLFSSLVNMWVLTMLLIGTWIGDFYRNRDNLPMNMIMCSPCMRSEGWETAREPNLKTTLCHHGCRVEESRKALTDALLTHRILTTQGPPARTSVHSRIFLGDSSKTRSHPYCSSLYSFLSNRGLFHWVGTVITS